MAFRTLKFSLISSLLTTAGLGVQFIMLVFRSSNHNKNSLREIFPKKKILNMKLFVTTKGHYKCPKCSKKWTSNVVRTGNKPGLTLKKCKTCPVLISPYKLVHLYTERSFATPVQCLDIAERCKRIRMKLPLKTAFEPQTTSKSSQNSLSLILSKFHSFTI